jgi:hypothetical protein
MGPPISPAKAIVPPTAMAAFGPTTRARVAVFKMTVSRSKVSTTSNVSAFVAATCARVAPRSAVFPKITRSTAAAPDAATSCAAQYAGTSLQRKPRAMQMPA